MTLQGEYLCIGYAWRDASLMLRLRSWSDPSLTEELLVQGALHFRVTDKRRCTGYFDFASACRIPCEEDAVPEKKHQCEACIDREGFVPWMRCDGRQIPELLPAVRAYIESPHFLYLACFGDAQVKVGMASAKRKQARLDDQGPLVARYVAKGSGIQIRQLEVEISRLGYIELMRRSRKRRLLVEGEDAQAALPRLDRALKHIRGQLQEEHASLLLPEPQDYGAPDTAVRARGYSELEPLELSPNKIYQFDVLAASGSVAVVNDGGVRSSIETSELVGSVLEFAPKGEVEREARQIGLF